MARVIIKQASGYRIILSLKAVARAKQHYGRHRHRRTSRIAKSIRPPAENRRRDWDSVVPERLQSYTKLPGSGVAHSVKL